MGRLMKWEYTQLRFVPRGKSWTGEIEELWLDEQQLISPAAIPSVRSRWWD